QWNPAKIYDWLKCNIQSEWYWGVQKGAEETLRQKSGNDADQACLFVALLRASGYPSRYVRGTMEFFPNLAKAKELIGIENEQDLLSFFRKAGIPAKTVIAGGKIQNIQIEHIWVESQIPYANYRGAVIDTHGKTWLGLDTHIKNAGYKIKTSKPWPETLDIRNIRDQYLAQNQTQDPIGFLQGYINAWLDQNQPGTTYQDLLETRTLVPDIMKIVPASMQISQIAITHEYADLPDELIHQIRFKAYRGQEIFFNTVLPAWKLSNNKVTLTYEPETIEDQGIINSFGGLDNTPAYLVRLRPVIKVNGERVIIGEAGLPMGSEYVLDLELVSPNGTEKISNTQIMGNLVILGIVSQQAITPQELPSEEQDAEYLLHKEAMHYIDRWNRAEEELGSLLKLAVLRPIPTLVTLGGVIEVDFLLNQPHRFNFKGIFMDADLRAVELVPDSSPLSPNSSFILDPSSFMRLSSLHGSVLEHKVIEEDFGIECISTAKLFGFLNSQPANPQPINITRTNIATILPTLAQPQNIKDAITNAVNQGFTVRVPQTELTYEDWTGTGYIVERLKTGEAGYMLSGQIAGGMTALSGSKWTGDYWIKVSNPFLPIIPNPFPSAAYTIKKIKANDFQHGVVGKKLKNKLQVMVRDKNEKPVLLAKVIFTIRAGGGKFSNGGQTYTAYTW
ncbi:MAG: transglutaminase domain-containing protein, partial [Desulfobacteraceae bacterium]